jgi:hypothetical protein
MVDLVLRIIEGVLDNLEGIIAVFAALGLGGWATKAGTVSLIVKKFVGVLTGKDMTALDKLEKKAEKLGAQVSKEGRKQFGVETWENKLETGLAVAKNRLNTAFDRGLNSDDGK